jgi:asparagine synthase (glutamine-hydrolysing)
MAVALEARVPLLDHRVVALAWSLPVSFRIRNGVSKAPLRDLLARFVRRDLFERPKAGFGIPVGDWLRGPLRDWGEALIAPARIREQGFLDERRVRSLWQHHLQGSRSSDQGIWAILMFQAWLAEQRPSPRLD